MQDGRSEGFTCHMGVSTNRGTPKWMVYNGKPMKTLLKWMILGGTTIFGNIHIFNISLLGEMDSRVMSGREIMGMAMASI